MKDTNNKSKKLLFLVAFSSAVIAAFVAPRFFDSSEDVKSTKISAEDFSQYVVHTKYMSNHKISEEKQQAYDLYESMEFEKALPSLESLCAKDKDSMTCYYVGICYFFLGNNDKAEYYLNHPGTRHFASPI